MKINFHIQQVGTVLSSLCLCLFLQASAQDAKLMDSLEQVYETQDDTTRLMTLHQMVLANFSENPKKAEELAIQMYKESSTLNYPKGLGQALINLSDLAYWNDKDISKAVKWLEGGITAMESGGINESLTELYLKYCKLLQEKGDYTKTVDKLDKVIAFAKENDKKELLRRALSLLGYTHEVLSNYDKSVEARFATLEVAEELNDTVSMIYTLNDIGSSYYLMQKPEKARIYFNKALEYFERQNNEKNIAWMNYSIGITYYYDEDWETMVSYMRKILPTFERFNMIREMGNTNNCIGEYHSKTGNGDSALYYSKRGYKYFRELNDPYYMVYADQQIADAYNVAGQYDKALEHATKAYNDATSHRFKYLSRYCSEVLSRIYMNLNQYEKALEFKQLEYQYKDSVMNSDQTESIVKSELEYELKKQEKASRQLNKEKTRISEELESKQVMIYILFAVIGVLVIGLFMARRKK